MGVVSLQNSVAAVEARPSEPTVPFLKPCLPAKDNQKITPPQKKKTTSHNNQNIPKPGSVPAGKGHRKGQSVTTESEAVRPARTAPV